MKKKTLVQRYLARSGFAKGYASAFSLLGNDVLCLPAVGYGKKEDKEALLSDWRAVGSDMSRAFDLIGNETSK